MGDWDYADHCDRQNYLKETTHMADQQQYDNNNKGSLFVPRSDKSPANLSGSAEVNGDKFYLDYFKLGEKCAGILVLKSADDENVEKSVVLFKSTKGKAVMYGSFNLDGQKYYVNVLKKDRKSESSPILGLYFSPSEAGSGQTSSKAQKDYDDDF